MTSSSSAAGAKVQWNTASVRRAGACRQHLSKAVSGFGKALGFSGVQSLARGFFFAEHAFARTGSIRMILWKNSGSFFTIFLVFIWQQRGWEFRKAQVAKKGSGSGRTDVVSNQKAGAF